MLYKEILILINENCMEIILLCLVSRLFGSKNCRLLKKLLKNIKSYAEQLLHCLYIYQLQNKQRERERRKERERKVEGKIKDIV